MLIGNPIRPAQLLLLTSALWLTAVAPAALKDKPPKGVALSGVWQLDPYRSDDPRAVLEKARQDMPQRSGGHRSGRTNRGVFGGDGPWGGGDDDGGTWGGGDYPGGGGHRGGGFPGGGRGGWGHDRGGGSTDRDPAASGHGSAGARGELLTQLSKNPDKLSFDEANHDLRVSADPGEAIECAAAMKVAITDAAGAAERNCGWDGRAWVIETTRGKDFKRTDRYELSRDAQTLTYVTTASGSRLPKIKISRTYTPGTAASPAAASPAATSPAASPSAASPND